MPPMQQWRRKKRIGFRGTVRNSSSAVGRRSCVALGDGCGREGGENGDFNERQAEYSA